MSFVLSVIRERLRRRLGLQPQMRERIIYQQLRNETQAQKTPLFGTSPGFGTDYIVTRSIPAPVMGVARRDTPRVVVNRSSCIAGLEPANTYSRSEIQETRRRLPTKGTDIKALPRGSAIRWDGKVRIHNKMKTFESSRERSETHRDRLTKEMENEPYSFFS